MIFKHELKRYLKTFLVWLFSIAALILVCMLLYPEMKGSIENVNDMFSDMGSFTEAFGMNRLNFGTPMGFYGIEVGSILSIGAPLFAAQIGISLLAKEEGQHTAEFLFSHPISRTSVYFREICCYAFLYLIIQYPLYRCCHRKFYLYRRRNIMEGIFSLSSCNLCFAD